MSIEYTSVICRDVEPPDDLIKHQTAKLEVVCDITCDFGEHGWHVVDVRADEVGRHYETVIDYVDGTQEIWPLQHDWFWLLKDREREEAVRQATERAAMWCLERNAEDGDAALERFIDRLEAQPCKL